MPDEAARPATTDDVDVLVELFTRAALELAEARGANVYLVREAPVPDGAVVGEWIADPEVCVLAGTLDGVVVGGGVAVTENLRDASVLGVIRVLYVEAAAREVGVGEELLAALVGWCRDRGAAGVDSLALPGERWTKNFYEAAGFKARLLTVHHRVEPVDP